MNTDEIKHIIDTYYRKLKKYSKKTIKNFDEEAIHQFRVEYKKLRAFLRMLSQDSENGREIKIPKNLKNIYRISGNIRDLQIQQQRIKQTIKKGNKIPKPYLNVLKKEIKRLQPELVESFLEHPLNESKKDTKASVPNEFNWDGFKKFASKKWANIYNIISCMRYSDDNIHAVRKNLKDLFYNIKLIREYDNESLSSEILKGKKESAFDVLLEQLGGFQDKCTALSLLKTYWMNDLKIIERELLQTIKYEWLLDKKKIKEVLIKKLEIEFSSIHDLSTLYII